MTRPEPIQSERAPEVTTIWREGDVLREDSRGRVSVRASINPIYDSPTTLAPHQANVLP